MANNGPVMLPQFQGTMYDIQRKQALAQALTQDAMQPINPGMPGAKISPWQSVAKLGNALLGSYLAGNAGQDMNQLGQQQYGAMLNMFGGGQPMGADSGSDASTLSVPADAPPDTQYGFTPPSVQQQPASPSGARPLGLSGMSPQQTAMAYMLDPSETMKAIIAQRGPTDFVKTIAQAGIDPNSALGRQLIQGQIAKQNFIEPTSVRPGGYVINNMTGQKEWMPHVQEGGMPVQDPNGNFTGAVVPQPGATGIEQAMSGAKAAGQAQYQVLNGFDAQGNPTYTTAYQAATGGGQPGATQPSPRSAAMFPGYQPPTGTVRPGLAPGEADARGVQAKANAERGVSIINDLANAKNDLFNYRELAQLSNEFNPGTGADSMYKVNGYLSRFLPSGLAPSDKELSSYQTFSKLATQIAAQQQKSLGGVADNTLQTLMKANPNPNMQRTTIQNVTSYLQGLSLARMGKASAYQQWLDNGNSPANEHKFESAWNQAYDPRVYMIAAMSPEQRSGYLGTLPAGTVKALQGKARIAAQNGFLRQDWLQ